MKLDSRTRGGKERQASYFKRAMLSTRVTGTISCCNRNLGSGLFKWSAKAPSNLTLTR